MKSSIELPYLNIIIFYCIKFLKLHDFSKLLYLIVADMLGRPFRGKSFRKNTNSIHIIYISNGYSYHHGALVRYGSHKLIMLKLTDCLSYGSPAHAKLLRNFCFYQTFSGNKRSFENRIPKLRINGVEQRISVSVPNELHICVINPPKELFLRCQMSWR
ncbi:hypothetical protein SDC9_166540 [bioreactor metagenome]|uniref:Uncharacterized protein n=1 Tax=bioreactor metagenome TaxID=1076179 RepID=A0A645G4V4_9ZZZZ